MPGKTDIRWSDSEWAALQRYAEVVCGTPGKAAKWIVCQHLREAGVLGWEIGSAAPREGEFAGLREAVLSNGVNVPVVGAAEEASAGRLEPGKRVDVVATPRRSATAGAAATPVPPSPPASGAFGLPPTGAPDLMAELKASLDRVPPGGSAGSGARPPAGGSAADSPAVAEPAVEEGVRLLDAVVAALRAQGVTNGVELVARRAIRSGGVVVDGEACTDPERLVDPASLGAPS